MQHWLSAVSIKQGYAAFTPCAWASTGQNGKNREAREEALLCYYESTSLLSENARAPGKLRVGTSQRHLSLSNHVPTLNSRRLMLNNGHPKLSNLP